MIRARIRAQVRARVQFRIQESGRFPGQFRFRRKGDRRFAGKDIRVLSFLSGSSLLIIRAYGDFAKPFHVVICSSR